jgi:hypothetical protein
MWLTVEGWMPFRKNLALLRLATFELLNARITMWHAYQNIAYCKQRLRNKRLSLEVDSAYQAASIPEGM